MAMAKQTVVIFNDREDGDEDRRRAFADYAGKKMKDGFLTFTFRNGSNVSIPISRIELMIEEPVEIPDPEENTA